VFTLIHLSHCQNPLLILRNSTTFSELLISTRIVIFGASSDLCARGMECNTSISHQRFFQVRLTRAISPFHGSDGGAGRSFGSLFNNSTFVVPLRIAPVRCLMPCEFA